MSGLVRPCCFSGRGRRALESISICVQCTEISPVCVLNTYPLTPTMSPMS